ncbi:MAG: DUF2490 domain-containing protein [Polaribacter sp.]|nr:DUF2490 domain-containing protein [Polaribacter sp.]
MNLTFGVSYTNADTEYQNPFNLLTEFKLNEHLNLNHNLGDFKLRHRFRFEHRFIEINDIKSTVNWLRYDLNRTYSISENWNFYAFNEIFF